MYKPDGSMSTCSTCSQCRLRRSLRWSPRLAPSRRVKGLAPFRADGIPILAVLADSHAALFAHGAFGPGPVKATQGTGSSVMGLLGPDGVTAQSTLGSATPLPGGPTPPALAFEGNIRSAGSTVLWAPRFFGVDAAELARLAATVADAGNVHLVPGFNGLAAPWWDSSAVGLLSGVSLGSGRSVIARAALDSIAHQIADVSTQCARAGFRLDRLMVDGGPTRNDLLMQFEADMVGRSGLCTETSELSALGAAHLAGVGAGL